jgi:hypothetical protein
LSGLPEGCLKLVARQVEKGKPFAMRRRKIISRLYDDLNRRFSREHLDSDFRILEIYLIAASIGSNDDGVRHVGPLFRLDRIRQPHSSLNGNFFPLGFELGK